MSVPALLIAALFLPLFPLSMPFNLLYERIRHPLARGLLLLVWPQIGLAVVSAFELVPSNWMLAWALMTSLLYALRALALREVGLWTSFVATSSWALLWILLGNDAESFQLKGLSFGISVPLMLMALLGAGLERRFGAAYLGLYGGLAESVPRFSGVLVVVVLAIVATPVSPAFFALFSMIIKTMPVSPAIALGVGLVWFLWSWAGACLLQGLIVGPKHGTASDLNSGALWLFIAVLLGITLTGIYWAGGMA